jgi:hypothetical protein
MQFHESGVTRSTRAVALAAAMLVASLPALNWAAAAESGPFAPLDGVWTGSGTVSLQNGTKERLRCRAQYVITSGGSNLQQSLKCDSDTYHFHVTAYVNEKGGNLSGNWTEETKNVSGSISGKASGSQLSVSISAGSAFSARMSVVTSGSSQSVSIKPKGDTDITDVSVKMSRSH